MLPFYSVYPTRPTYNNIGECIKKACKQLGSLLNQLEPTDIYCQHIKAMKQALFHSHTKVVSLSVKQFLRLASDKELAEKMSGDMDIVLGLIENLAHKDLRVARDCVKMLLMMSCSEKAIVNLLCPDITDVLKTIMTYVAVRILVYEFIMQLSINSPFGLEKSYASGVLEDAINDFKRKESYLTTVHYYQLHSLAATPHGHSFLAKYDAEVAVPKQCPDVTNDIMTHLIQVTPLDSFKGCISNKSASEGEFQNQLFGVISGRKAAQIEPQPSPMMEETCNLQDDRDSELLGNVNTPCLSIKLEMPRAETSGHTTFTEAATSNTGSLHSTTEEKPLQLMPVKRRRRGRQMRAYVKGLGWRNMGLKKNKI